MAEGNKRWRKPTLPAFGVTVETAAPDGRFGMTALVAEVGEAALWRGHVRKTSQRLGLLVFDSLAEGDPSRTIRLLEAVEAATAAPLPGVLEVQGFADDDDRVLVLLEPLLGVSMRTVIVRDAPLAAAAAVDMAVVLAQAMRAVHAAGACWGAVEPEYILVRSDEAAGGVQLLPPRLCALAHGGTTLEAIGLRGAIYRAPEVLLGEAATAAADVFSLGVLLFELLTGESPFEGHNVHTLAARVISAPARRLASCPTFVEALAAGTPVAPATVSALQVAIDRLMDKEARARPADAGAAAELLAPLRGRL